MSKGKYIGGLLITLGNPKVILFYAGFLPTFMHLTRLTPCDILVMIGVVAVVLAGVLATYAFSAARARHLLARSSRSVTQPEPYGRCGPDRDRRGDPLTIILHRRNPFRRETRLDSASYFTVTSHFCSFIFNSSSCS